MDLGGKAMVHWVADAAVASGIAEDVVVATPDDEIIDYCTSHGIRVARTRADHPSGTDRLAEVAQTLIADVYVNVQGDEPLVRPATIQACAQPLLDDATIPMGSVYSACPEDEEDNPAVVKVVTDLDGFALYFSRHAVPFPRNPRVDVMKKHVGIYAFRRDVLQQFASWQQTPLEMSESLEQLRFLEHGVRIKMSRGEGSELAVDTPEQAEEVRAIIAARAGA